MRNLMRPAFERGWLELSAGPLLAAGSVLAMSLASTPSEAQGYRAYPVSRYEASTRSARLETSRPRTVRSKPRAEPAKTKTAATAPRPQEPVAARAPGGPLLLLVNLRRQNVAVYSGATEIARSPISSGRVGYDTPSGVFSIIQKNREHYSNLYDNAPMPNMQRITWSGVALHAGHLPGYPASHGCVRLPMSFSTKLFGMTQMGTRVIVTHGETAPMPFAHRLLFSPLPEGDPAAPTPRQEQASAELAPQGSDVAKVQLASVQGGAEIPEAGLPAPAVRTRASVAAERAAEKARLADEISTRRDAHAQMLETLKSTNVALAQAREDRRAIAAELERANKALANTSRRHHGLADRLAEAGRRAGEEQSSTGKVALDGLEDEIDAKLLDAAYEVELLRAEMEDLAGEAAEASNLIGKLEAARAAAHSEAANASDQLKVAMSAQAQFLREDAKRALPASVFISRRTGRLYVRQGFEPILESPVTIKDAEAPLGTHVFTALGSDRNGGLLWSVVTVPDAPLGIPAAQRTVRERNDARRNGNVRVASWQVSASPASALERIEVPANVRERIEELVKPGSSLIISDLPASRETGRGTDFVLLTR